MGQFEHHDSTRALLSQFSADIDQQEPLVWYPITHPTTFARSIIRTLGTKIETRPAG